MYYAHVLVLILHLINGRLPYKSICVEFRNEDEGTVETRNYNANCAIFRVSRRLSLELSKTPECSTPHQGCEVHVYMGSLCKPQVFEITAALCDDRQLSNTSAEDIAGVLRLAEHLDIQDESKAAFYMGLAEVSDVASIREEKAVCFSTHSAKIYALQLLRKHMRTCGLETIVRGEQATLCTRGNYGLKHVYGSATEIDVVSEVKVTKNSMSSVALQDREILFWLADVLETRTLDVSGCDLDADTMALVSGIKGLTRLDISNCRIEPGILKHLQEMKSLRELVFMWGWLERSCAADIGRAKGLECLDISCCRIEPGSIGCLQELENLRVLSAFGTTLCSNEISEIGDIRSLEKLSIGRCELCPESIRHLQRLVNLRELGISYNRLCSDDAEELAKMACLSVLDISNCKVEPRCLVHLAGLCLKELSVSCSRMHKSNLYGIGKIKSLVKLDMHGCNIRPGCFSFIKKLKNLRDLCVSCNELSKGDLAAICTIQSLEILNISCCKIRPGSLRHIRKLHGLRELSVSHNSMSRDDINKIKGLRLDKLEDRGCTIEPERPQKFQKLAARFRLLFMRKC